MRKTGNPRVNAMENSTRQPYPLLERFAGLCKGAKVGPRSARVREVRRAPQARDWPLTLIRKPL